MIGSDALISGIIAALLKSKDAFDTLHNQEHAWECDGFKDLEKWWDEANRDVWRIHHRLLKRLYKLGGKPAGVTADPVEAFTAALSLFQGLHEACQGLYAAAESDKDYVTSLKLAEIQTEIESWIVSAEKHLNQISKLDPEAKTTPFMQEQM
jgi:hypothetical protein